MLVSALAFGMHFFAAMVLVAHAIVLLAVRMLWSVRANMAGHGCGSRGSLHTNHLARVTDRAGSEDRLD